jgi:hypothetical protein
VCGGGAPTLPWKQAAALVYGATPAQRVPRMAAHPYGGSRTKGGYIKPAEKCSGTYGIPVELS